MEIAEDDPRMKAAIAEARRRWPEFVAAFEQRRPEQMFSVKVPIRDGEHVEHLWLTVLGLEGDLIIGQVGNEPVHVKKVRLGSRVNVRRGMVTDWLYTDSEAMTGGFSIKVLQELEEK